MPEGESSKKWDYPIKLAIYGGGLGYWGSLNPDVLKSDRMIGGAECSMIHVSRGLARRGYDVTVFYGDVDSPGVYDGVSWRDAREYNPRECYDILISWDVMLDGVGIFKYQPCAHLRVLEMQCNHPRITAEHGVHWITPKSEWHKNAIMHFNPNIAPEQCYIMPNGVDLARYTQPHRRIHGRVIWSSSPDRGLHHLLRIWPRVLRQIPDATLHIFYDFDRNFDANKWQMNHQAECMWYIKTHLDQPGVVHRQGVGQRTLAKEQSMAQVMAYPCDPPVPCEGFCISILECLAAGTPVVASDADCIPELWGGAITMLQRPIDDQQWAEAIVHLLRDKNLRQHLRSGGKALAEHYTWEKNTARWDRFLREKLAEVKYAR